MSKRTSHRVLWPSEVHRQMSAEDVALAGPELGDARRGCVGLGCAEDEQHDYVIEDLPLCNRHFMAWMRSAARYEDDSEPRRAAHRAAPENQRVVYYIRFADHIKIGRSKHLYSRMQAMHVHPDALLAVEPGDHRTELQRHTMFADERVARTELFDPSSRLLEHIEHVRSLFGDPKGFLPDRSPYILA